MRFPVSEVLLLIPHFAAQNTRGSKTDLGPDALGSDEVLWPRAPMELVLRWGVKLQRSKIYLTACIMH